MEGDYIKIEPNDIVSGRQYLKLINAYKAHDRKRKEYIARLRNDIDDYKMQIKESELMMDFLKEQYESEYEELKTLVLETGEIGDLIVKIAKYKLDIRRAGIACARKNKEIKQLNNQISILQNELTLAKLRIAALESGKHGDC
ncbi:hypothetical protein [uncultured Muribaculum sp.]|uniref:hypothetical protein n=1 Tax=uncultured Muribaculum sp. TaxID=1918613 RepID=UPI0026485F4A|nr:hypothetical protein [uncultured Muribaculum sp.]